MERREYLTAVAGLGLASIAGCTEETGDDSGGRTTTEAPDAGTSTTDETTSQTPETDATTAEEQTTEEPTTEESATEEQTTGGSDSSDSSYQIRIQYNGEWSGSVGGDGAARSVDGSGTRTFDIDGDPYIVSANAQKQDDSSGELTIQILENDEVIAERSTSAEYGVAQVTSEDGMGGTGSDDSSTGSESSFSVRVQYSGSWQGSVGTGGSTRTVEGPGSRTIPLEGSPDIISANAQKQDDSSDELTIQILEDGDVVEETSTSASYGVAQVSYSSF